MFPQKSFPIDDPRSPDRALYATLLLPVKQGGKRKVTGILIMSAFNQSADLVQMDQSDWGQKGVKISSSLKYRMKKYTKYKLNER